MRRATCVSDDRPCGLDVDLERTRLFECVSEQTIERNETNGRVGESVCQCGLYQNARWYGSVASARPAHNERQRAATHPPIGAILKL